MEINKNLVLLGMMGSGKSTIGRILSKKLNLSFIDIDNEIEKNEGSIIKEIFDKKGEKHFRKIEEKITLKHLGSKNIVISLGGGGFLNNKIRSEILANHFSFWLKWKNSTLIERIQNSKKRPIAINSSSEELKLLILKRSKFYSKANYKIDCNKLLKQEIADKIIKLYERN